MELPFMREFWEKPLSKITVQGEVREMKSLYIKDCSASDLVEAILNNNTEEAIQLLEKDVDPDVINSTGTPALCLAIKILNIGILGALLRSGANISTDFSDFTSPGLDALHLCFDEPDGKEPIMSMLLQHNIDLRNPEVGGLGHQVWSWAVKNNYVTVLGVLLDRNIPVDIMSDGSKPDEEEMIRLQPFSHQTALYSAFETSNYPLADWLLSRGAHPDCRGCKPSPLLELSRRCYHHDPSHMILLLLHKGADPNVFDEFTGQSILSLLCERECMREASLAIDKGAGKTINHVSRFQKMSALHFACRASTPCASLISELIKAGASVNLKDKNGHTPLWHVANWGNMENADILLKKGALVNDHGAGSTTPLMEAARYNAAGLVKHLVNNGADVNAQSTELENYVLLGPIQRPDHKTKVLVLRYLIAKGANVLLAAGFPRQPLTDAMNASYGDRSNICIATIIRAIVKQHGSEELKSIFQKSKEPFFVDEIVKEAFREVGISIFNEVQSSWLDGMDPSKWMETIHQNPDGCDVVATVQTVDEPWATNTKLRYFGWRTDLMNLEAGDADEELLNIPTNPASGSAHDIVYGRSYAFTAAGGRGNTRVSGFLTGGITTDRAISEADEYMKKLQNRRDFLLDCTTIDTYKPVKIAILDSGLDAKHPVNPFIRGYKDFTLETENRLDKTRHGTNGVLATFAVVPDAHVYVARVFDEEPTHLNTPSVVAQAIQHAINIWEVDVIAMSFGFVDVHTNIRREILNANIKNVLIFAAVGNEGNRNDLAFPARVEGSVLRVFSTNGMAITSREFNPPPSLYSIMNFGFLGEHVRVLTAEAMYTLVDGTSVATSIAAATAALLIDFSQRMDCTSLSKREELRTVSGMSAVLAKLGVKEGNFYCFNPWSEYLNPRDQDAPSDSLKRKHICETINRELPLVI
ncbi:hypothetical protein V500_04124 [Pseudogymnoascus sp. VKM F-4518 (FW-2643)]|nr:hypothetical protein V500_04124 [Pseudogymnoascus sp. VKM F-4518 (FW-2643)]